MRKVPSVVELSEKLIRSKNSRRCQARLARQCATSQPANQGKSRSCEYLDPVLRQQFLNRFDDFSHEPNPPKVAAL